MKNCWGNSDWNPAFIHLTIKTANFQLQQICWAYKSSPKGTFQPEKMNSAPIRHKIGDLHLFAFMCKYMSCCPTKGDAGKAMLPLFI